MWCWSQNRLGSEHTTNSMGQKSSWICLRTSFSSTCINPQIGPQSLIYTISWNQCKSSLTWVWTSQNFLSLLTSSNLLFVLMEWNERSETLRPLLTLPTSSPLWPKCCIKWKFLTNVLLLLFYDVHLIMADHTQLITELKVWDLLHQIRADILFSSKLMILFQISKQLSFPQADLRHIQNAQKKRNQSCFALLRLSGDSYNSAWAIGITV